MHIKSVSIQGFKSYKDPTSLEKFSPKHNIVVGRNGSGKSNFFSAIQFVLSDEKHNLRAEERQQLLHEGTGARVLSACVEIIFDNSDSRMPIDKDEVILRRVIGSKKDQYFLNQKMVTKSDVMNILESAGFSRSNPYYIVKQGKINQMATAPDSDRLKLLREVAGVRVYDERKLESEKLMIESEERGDKVRDVLKRIEERLEKLESEKDELKQFQVLDKTRRSMEYAIHNHGLIETKTKLSQISHKRETNSTQTKFLRENQDIAHKRTKDAHKQLMAVNTRLENLLEEKENASNERQDIITKKAQLELACAALQDKLEADKQSFEQMQAEMQELEEKISKKTQELDTVLPQYENTLQTERDTERNLQVAQQRRKELFAKKGRRNQFRSQDERDNWISGEIRTLQRNMRDRETQIKNLQEEIQRSKNELETLDTDIGAKTQDIQNTKTQMDSWNRESLTLKRKKDELQVELQKLWRDESKISQETTTISSEIKLKEHTLNSLTGKAKFHGIESMRKVRETFRQQGRQDLVDGYKGMVIENFKCTQNFFTCVEVTAGGRLFDHIVETDRTGILYLQEMNRQKLPGEVTFLPLNKLQVNEVVYPQTSDAIPMISKLQYEDHLEVIFQFIFGKTLVCRSMEISTQLARAHQLDCVTLDGDQVSRRGALTGGYVDTSKSRLDLYISKQELQNDLEEKQSEVAANKDQQQTLESESTTIMDKLQNLETRIKKTKDILDMHKAELRMRKEAQQTVQRTLEPKEKSLNELKKHLESLKSTELSLNEEMGTDLLSQLSTDDQTELDTLNDEIKQLTSKHKQSVEQRVRLEGKKTSLENLLRDNLHRHKEQRTQEMQELSVDASSQKLMQSENERKIKETQLETIDTRLKELKNDIIKLENDQKVLGDTVEELRNKEREWREKISEDARELEKVSQKQSILLKKKEEFMKKINDLGTLPQGYEQYENMALRELVKKLEKCNQELKKYSHVNKKALDQYLLSSEQKDKLVDRLEEFDRGKQAVVQLMQHLEEQKQQQIQFTFGQVSKNFGEIFQKIVPGGKATLIMKKADSQAESSSSGSTSQAPDEFVGIGIKVSFSGNEAETREMNQLSGGQKSLVALALIFAIQKCDPAPFYLFDEIDQALDPAHRASVGRMIHEMSQSAQFITTTFRPELLETADKFYGVFFRNKVTLVREVSREEAREFVEDDAVHS